MVEHRVRVNLLGTAVVLAIGVGVSAVTSTVVAGRALAAHARAQARARQDITVRGSARVRVSSDLAVWKITVSSEHRDLTAAFGLLEASGEAVQRFLASKGFAAGETEAGSIETSQYYARDAAGRETREVAGYALSRSFVVTGREVGRVRAASAEITELLRDGVKVVSQPPRYMCSKLPDVKVQILGEAAKDARTRAEEVVKNSGGRLGALRDAQAGVMQVTEPNSTDVSAGGVYDTGTIDKDVSVVVTATFAVEEP